MTSCVGTIYAIIDDNQRIMYVGQTIRKLKRRIASYRTRIKNGDTLKVINYLRCHCGSSDIANRFVILEENISDREELDKCQTVHVEKCLPLD